MSKRNAAFDDDDSDDAHAESTPVQPRVDINRSSASDSLSVRSEASVRSDASCYAPSRSKQPKKAHLSNSFNKQSQPRGWTEIPARSDARSSIAQRLGGKPILSPAPTNALCGSPSVLQNSRTQPNNKPPQSEEERLVACYAALTKQSAVQIAYKCPLPSASPRNHSDATICSSLSAFANWIESFPSQEYGIDRTPSSVLLAPSAADSQFFTVLCSETAANWCLLNETGKLLPQVFGKSLQGPLLPLSLIQATGNTPAFLSIVKNRPIQLEFFSPLASNTFIPSLNGSLNMLPPPNQLRSIFVAANPESVPSTFEHFFICFKRFAAAANRFFIDGTGHPFRAEEFSCFLNFMESCHIGYPALAFEKFAEFFSEWTSFCCTPIWSPSTAFLTLTRLSTEGPERSEIWSRITGLAPVPPTGSAREIWLARAISSKALVPISTTRPSPSNTNEFVPLSSRPVDSAIAVAEPKPKKLRKFISLQVNDIRGLKHEGKELCLGWNSHNCSRHTCYRSHICVYCFKESSVAENHRAWDKHEHLRVHPKSDFSGSLQQPQRPFL
ncbi:hypothetical protein BDR26DRAFT_902941 [Obelidium mucronatum]|nr:hypothetical protein BDR26DRAFT_902941 [Obelidium mucronatum]